MPRRITYLKYVFDQLSLISDVEREAETDQGVSTSSETLQRTWKCATLDSIALDYGENVSITLDLGLTPHENAWVRDILKSYLAYLKDLRYGVPFTLRPFTLLAARRRNLYTV